MNRIKSLLAAGLAVMATAASAQPEFIRLFPDGAPGETTRQQGTEAKGGVSAGRPYRHWVNVSDPTIQFYPAPAGHNTRTAVIVCPGGAYEVLAYDYEGTEVCAWLNSIGVNAVLLRYRVPRRKGQPKHAAPLQDVQRAMSLVRANATQWGFDADRIGVLGFSAGGHLSAMLCSHSDRRTYSPVDAADSVSLKPNFCVLVYPAYLNATPPAAPDSVAPEVVIGAATPPTFIAQNADDPYSAAGIAYALALRRAKVPCELHLYAKGGHGGGLRKTGHALSEWPERAATWLRRGGFME